ncbi:MAG: hypothetical protein ACNYWU_09190 [Desulfobacterales bacterium]
MDNIKVSNNLFSQLEKEISFSILHGNTLKSCAQHNGISEQKCRSIVNNFCAKSDHPLYKSLCWNQWENCAPISDLRKHAQEFIDGYMRNEEVTLFSSIWALPRVPTLTLNALEKQGITSIDKIVQCDERILKRFPQIGKYGLNKLHTSLEKFGFSIKK